MVGIVLGILAALVAGAVLAFVVMKHLRKKKKGGPPLCSVDLGQTCLYNCYQLWVGIWDEVFQLEHPCCCVGCTGVLLLGLMIKICCEMFFSLHGRDPFDPQLQPLRHK